MSVLRIIINCVVIGSDEVVVGEYEFWWVKGNRIKLMLSKY